MSNKDIEFMKKTFTSEIQKEMLSSDFFKNEEINKYSNFRNPKSVVNGFLVKVSNDKKEDFFIKCVLGGKDIASIYTFIRDLDKTQNILNKISPEIVSINSFNRYNLIKEAYTVLVIRAGLHDFSDPFDFAKSGDTLKFISLLIQEIIKHLMLLHSMGILHGDIKPMNMVLEYGSNHQYYGRLIDFDSIRGNNENYKINIQDNDERGTGYFQLNVVKQSFLSQKNKYSYSSDFVEDRYAMALSVVEIYKTNKNIIENYDIFYKHYLVPFEKEIREYNRQDLLSRIFSLESLYEKVNMFKDLNIKKVTKKKKKIIKLFI